MIKYVATWRKDMTSFDFLTSFDTLAESQRYPRDEDKSPNGLEVLTRFSRYVDGLDGKHVREMLHALHGKWAHTTNLDEVKRGVKRTIQRRFYVEIYGNDVPKSVVKADDRCLEALNLHDEPFVQKQPQHLKKFKPPQQKTSRERKEKTPKPTSRFSLKVAGMTLEEVIQWAQEIGVPQERIDKHKDKSLGLAKMNISNLIKGKLRKDGKLGNLFEQVMPD
jgi:hypothetical protein